MWSSCLQTIYFEQNPTKDIFKALFHNELKKWRICVNKVTQTIVWTEKDETHYSLDGKTIL